MAGGNGGRASTGLFGAAGMAIPGTAGQVAALPTFKPEEALMRKKSLITAETFRPVNA
jgi:hypothetical protein